MFKEKRSYSWKKAVACAAGILAIVFLGLLPARKVYAVPGIGEGNVGEDQVCQSMTFDLLTPEKLLPGDGAAATGEGETLAGKGTAEAEKVLPLAVIVIGFENLPYSDAYNWNEVLFSSSKSLSQYYKDMSFDKFTFVPARETSAFGQNGNTNAADQANDGVIHVKLKKSKKTTWNGAARWTQESAKEEYTSFRNAVIAAGKYLDFQSYDVSGNKTIETNELAVCFVVAGYDMAGGQHLETPSEKYLYIWPYAYDFSTYNETYLENTMPEASVNGIRINNYVALGEKMLVDNADRHEDMGTFAHELGHYLGLNDLYSLESKGAWSDYNVRLLSLMASGTHGSCSGESWLPFSLDIWSRVQLGWVEPQLLGLAKENYASDIAGSLTRNAKAPTALRIDTNHVDEYYLIENRRFSGWDKDLAQFYPSTASKDLEDGGGGLLLWHIDSGRISRGGDVNGYSLHPGVMPLFKEKNSYEEWGTIGEKVYESSPFFDTTNWLDTIILPVYGQNENDTPADRKTTRLLTISMDSPNGPVMRIHRHILRTPTVHWDASYALAELWTECDQCQTMILAERSRNITSKKLQNATTESPGKMRYTVSFRMDDIKEHRDINLPLVYGEEERLRLEAYQELTEALREAAALAGNASSYTAESWNNFTTAVGKAEKIHKNPEATEKQLRSAKTAIDKARKKLVRAIPISTVTVTGKTSVTFTGKALKPKYVLTLNGKTLKEGTDYTITYKNNVHPGKAAAVIKGTGKYVGQLKKTFTIKKAANTLKVSGKTVKVSAAKAAKAAVTVKRSNALAVSSAVGAVSFKLAKTAPAASAKYFKVTAGTGKITVKKGTPKGNYKLKITVTAAGDADYGKASKAGVVTIKVA